MDNLEECFAGKRLYGDDFDLPAILEWSEDEKEGYANLGAKEAADYSYGYHALNKRHGFRYLPDGVLGDVLGFGSAYGHELLPVSSRLNRITVVDPSLEFVRSSLNNIPISYVQPEPGRPLSLGDASVDLITCFGVLHHIPNVSFVVRDLARIVRPGGYLLVREPVVSMGDWRRPRRGLTKRERGIPLEILEAIVRDAGFDVVKRSLCMFSLTNRLFSFLGGNVYNSVFATWVDALLSRAFRWNLNYHAMSFSQRIRPTGVFLVGQKRVAKSPTSTSEASLGQTVCRW